MHFEKGNLYHVYNMGNNSQKLFFNEGNYLYFLQKVKNDIKPNCEILAYCLMPNHFHFMILANEKSVEETGKGKMQKLTRKFGTIQSSYSQALNNQRKTNGSYFRQKTKAKCITAAMDVTDSKRYALTCFFYIHHNPLNARLVKKLDDWQYSSYLDFCDKRNGTLPNKALAFEILQIDKAIFENIVHKPIHPGDLNNIW